MKGNIGIVAGYSSGRLLAPALRRRGVACIHIAPRLVPNRLLHTYNRNDYVDELIEDEHFDTLLQKLRSEDLLDVIAGSEIGVPLAWKLRKELFGTKVPMIEAFYDKWLQTERLRALGLRATRQGQFLEVAAAVDWARQQGVHQVVAKPSASTGSDNVFLCNEPLEESLAHAFAKILGQTNQLARKNSCVLVQERLLGDEYVVDLVIAGTEVRVAAIFKYTKKPANGAAFVYHSMEVMTLEDMGVRRVVEFAIEAGRGLVGPQFNSTTAVHMELIGDCMVEAGFRTHGGQGAILGGEVSGVGQIEMWVDAMVDYPTFVQYPMVPVMKATAREVFLISRHSGRLKEFAHLDVIERLPSFRRFAPRIAVGDLIKPTRDLLSSPGSIILVAEDRTQLDQEEAVIRELEVDRLYKIS